ncbi:MAG: hypothetical protein ACOC00_00150 [Halothiobacillaceae bacterium]
MNDKQEADVEKLRIRAWTALGTLLGAIILVVPPIGFAYGQAEQVNGHSRTLDELKETDRDMAKRLRAVEIQSATIKVQLGEIARAVGARVVVDDKR